MLRKTNLTQPGRQHHPERPAGATRSTRDVQRGGAQPIEMVGSLGALAMARAAETGPQRN
eukprot:CAMPEP_0175386628 /NCGR_PEP_ID=MMETSP0095-20121207/29454_1 /TAXON_ID=311494 /ORGANISM="Alexandrium monilatum, Strain CCMP3105" /LENGTH=59 /DNA_ID=CAMNT_0016685079 /DNA_START=100 /DNA_END=276 /DNA_ORIENTATION=-